MRMFRSIECARWRTVCPDSAHQQKGWLSRLGRMMWASSKRVERAATTTQKMVKKKCCLQIYVNEKLKLVVDKYVLGQKFVFHRPWIELMLRDGFSFLHCSRWCGSAMNVVYNVILRGQWEKMCGCVMMAAETEEWTAGTGPPASFVLRALL